MDALLAMAILWWAGCTDWGPLSLNPRTNPFDTLSIYHYSNPPFNLQAVNITDTSVRLTWADTALAVSQFVVARRNINASVGYVTLAALPPQSSFYEDHALPLRDTLYSYGLCGVFYDGFQIWSYITVALPGPQVGTLRGVNSSLHASTSALSRNHTTWVSR